MELESSRHFQTLSKLSPSAVLVLVQILQLVLQANTTSTANLNEPLAVYIIGSSRPTGLVMILPGLVGSLLIWHAVMSALCGKSCAACIDKSVTVEAACFFTSGLAWQSGKSKRSM